MTDLVTIGRRIRDREETIRSLKKQTLNKAAETISEVLLQGADLLKVKRSLEHGQWLLWLASHCPDISARTAQDYMKLASDPRVAADLIQAGSIRQALALLERGEENTDKKGEPRQWPPYLEAIGRLSKLVGYVDRFPIDKWPNEGLDKFRQDLEPIAARLWPEKFGAIP